MRTLTIGELKSHFSEVLNEVRDGDSVVIAYGRKKEKVAAIVPYDRVRPREERPLGLLQGKVEYRIGDDFEIGDDELLSS